MPPHVTPTKKARIVALFEAGVKPRDIATSTGLHPSTVRKQLAKLHENPDPYFKAPGRGRPCIFTPCLLRQAARAITSGLVHQGNLPVAIRANNM